MKDTAKKIVTAIGGANNLNAYTHCATRLRFDIKDESRIDQEALKSMPEVLGVVNKGGQFQLIIGPTVEQLYNQLVPLLKDVKQSAVVDANEDAKEQSKFEMVMSYVSGAIQPTLPVLIGAGMINALLAVAALCGLDKSSGTYTAWAAIANVGFTYLPVFVAFSAARRLRTNEYLAAAISLAMIVCFNQQEGMSIFGLPIPVIKYANCIVPVLLMVPLMVLVDRLVDKVIPAAAHFTIKPLIVFGIMCPVVLVGAYMIHKKRTAQKGRHFLFSRDSRIDL